MALCPGLPRWAGIRKVKPIWILLKLTEARDSEWQWHQLGHMQAFTSLQTGNHASTPPLSSSQAGCPSNKHRQSTVLILLALPVQCRRLGVSGSGRGRLLVVCWRWPLHAIHSTAMATIQLLELACSHQTARILLASCRCRPHLCRKPTEHAHVLKAHWHADGQRSRQTHQRLYTQIVCKVTRL